MLREARERFELLDELDTPSSTVTSVRQPAALLDLVHEAIELGFATNPQAVTVAAVRGQIETFA